jgi:hypothetical protein
VDVEDVEAIDAELYLEKVLPPATPAIHALRLIVHGGADVSVGHDTPAA